MNRKRRSRSDDPLPCGVRSGEGECKFWLEPIIALACNRGVRQGDLRRIEQLVFEHQEILRKAFHEYRNR